MKILLKRIISLMMAFCILISLLPVMAFSANTVELSDEGLDGKTVSMDTESKESVPEQDESNPYAGKTIACIGDSITAAYGVTKDETDYVTLLAQRLGMDYIRLGVSGTTLCTDGSRNCNIDKLTEANLNGADLVTIAMGINDFCAAGEGYYELGDINSTDSSTIYGAMRMWCERIAELRKTDSLNATQFYFLTPIICSWNNSVTTARDWDQSKTNIHGYTLRDLCNAIIEVAALYDVAVIDLNLLSGMYYVDAANNNTEVFGGDGVHPGEKGHEMMAEALANVLLQNHLRNDHEHAFGSWITTTWPSCSAGIQQRVCTVCSAAESRTLESIGEHRYYTVVTPPTPTQQGYTTFICSVCGDSYIGDYTDPVAPKSYRWEMRDNAMVSVATDGNTENALTLNSGSITDATFSNIRYSMQKEVRLYHDMPWVIEWRSAGNWNGMLFSSTAESPSDGLTYLFREAGMKLFAFGEYNSSWNNYGIILDCDMTASHVFRLENRIEANGTNGVYLLVDGKEIDAMHHYYISGNDQNKTVNWANGKDIVFSNIGTSSHPVSKMKPDYLQIWESYEEAEGSFSLGERLQQLPEGYQGENLWPLLRHDPDYYTTDGWGVHSSGNVKSVTIPVNAGDKLVATSFGAAGSNGGSLNGIRVSYFSTKGLLISMTVDKVYGEYSKNGYLTVPDEATAVCIPMWKEQGAELYLIRSEMEPKNFSYILDEENRTVTLTKYTGTEKTVSVLPKYMVDDKIYSTVLDSASVFRGNSALSSAKIHAGVSFKDDSMAYLFSECKNLLSVDMTGVDTSSITDMGYLFDWCSKLSSILGYENWDTGSVINIYKMFNRTSALTKIDLSAWDLSQVINSGWCFQMCMASEILLPDNLKTMSAGFLNHATQYAGTTFTLPSGVEKVGYAHTIYDFATNDFVEFKVAEGNTHYSAIDGILYSADGREMLAVPRNKSFENGIYEIPEGVSFLGELSFSRNYNINTLVLPNSLEIRYVPLYDPEYIVFEDVGNLNAGNSLSIAIYSYTGITDYAVKEDNPNYASVDGIIYTKDMSTVVAVPSRYNKHMNIPEGVTTWLTEALWVGDSTTVDNLMANCSGISIPSSLTNIADDQIAKLNKLKGMFESFEIEVSTDNPVYCTDENGFLVLRATGLKGDLDLDGSVNSEDLTLLARHIAGIELLTGIAMNNGDVNGDGMISADDLTKHARYVAGIITNWE